MTRHETIKESFFRMIALALLAVSAAFTFPDSHYSIEKTFIKSPAPQTEACSLIADDIEDSDDCSTDTHFFHDFIVSHIEFPAVDVASTKMPKVVTVHLSEPVYLLLKQLLI